MKFIDLKKKKTKKRTLVASTVPEDQILDLTAETLVDDLPTDQNLAKKCPRMDNH